MRYRPTRNTGTEVDIDGKLKDINNVVDLPLASDVTIGGVRTMKRTEDMITPVGVDGEGGLWVRIPKPYKLPTATTETLGGVKPNTNTPEMTQAVGVDEDGKLWTYPSGTSTGSGERGPKGEPGEGGSSLPPAMLLKKIPALSTTEYYSEKDMEGMSMIMLQTSYVPVNSYNTVSVKCYGNCYTQHFDNLNTYTDGADLWFHFPWGWSSIDGTKAANKCSVRVRGDGVNGGGYPRVNEYFYLETPDDSKVKIHLNPKYNNRPYTDLTVDVFYFKELE